MQTQNPATLHETRLYVNRYASLDANRSAITPRAPVALWKPSIAYLSNAYLLFEQAAHVWGLFAMLNALC